MVEHKIEWVGIIKIERVEVIKENWRAILIMNDDLGEEWIPKVAIWENSKVKVMGDKGSIILHDWFAREKGWI